MKRIKRGFTVFELIIAIAVIAALSAVLVPSFIGLTAKTKLAQDKALLNNLNNALVISKKGGNKKVKTMHEAVLAVKRGGYTTDKLVTASGEDLVFSVADNQFHLSSEIEVGKEYECFKMYDSMPEYEEGDRMWSIYAKEGFTQKEISNLTVGFDVGYNKDIKYITYVGENDVVINTYNGVLTINSSAGKVSHYGIAQTVDILEISSSSYFEEGTSTFVRLNKGRVVVTPSSSIGAIHLLENDDKYNFIKIGVIEDTPLPTISRDEVSEDLKTTNGTYDKYICELQNLSDREDEEPLVEHVWLEVKVASSTPTSSALISTEAETLTKKSDAEVTDQGKDACLYLGESSSVSESEEEAYATVEAEVPVGAVARCGAIYYDTLQEALTKVSNKGKVTVLQNCSVTESFETTRNFILDLNGKTVTTTTFTISIVDGGLTVMDSSSGGKISGTSEPAISATNSTITINSGEITTTAATDKQTLYIGENSKFYLKGGLVKGKNCAVTLENILACELTGGKLQTTTGSTKYYTLQHKTQTLNTEVEVQIKGNVEIIGKAGYALYGRNVRISESAKISSTGTYAVALCGETYIEGGTITASAQHAILVTSGGLLTITSGTVTPKSGKKKIIVSSTSTGLVSASSTASYLTSANFTSYAKIYDTDGTTLLYYGAGYGAAKNPLCSGKIVKLTANITLTAKQYITISQSVTFDLNGHNITQATEAATAVYLFYISAVNVTIKGSGTCSYTEPDSLNSKAVYLFYIRTSVAGTINIEGGTYLFNINKEGRNYFYVYTVINSSTLNFKGGTFGSSAYPSAVFFNIRTPTIAKRLNIYFTGGSYYGFDPANHGTTYNISVKSGYTSSLNSETGYYEVTANS